MGQSQGLESTDGRLREAAHPGHLQMGQGLSNVRLGHSQFDPPLLEMLGEPFQFPWVCVDLCKFICLFLFLVSQYRLRGRREGIWLLEMGPR